MRLLPRLLLPLALLVLPPSCGTAPDVIVLPPPSCPTGPAPAPPALSSVGPCPSDPLVCMNPLDAIELGQWIRETGRWTELAEVCLSIDRSPSAAGPPEF